MIKIPDASRSPASAAKHTASRAQGDDNPHGTGSLTDRVAARIKDLRIKTGLSKSAFAVKIGVEPSYYSQVENNRIKPSLELIVQIGMAFYSEFPEASAHNIIYDPPIGQPTKYSPHLYFAKNLDGGAMRCALSLADGKEMQNGRAFSPEVKTILVMELLTAYERTILEALEGGANEFTARQKAEAACQHVIDTFGPSPP